jgi:hypothetical protein
MPSITDHTGKGEGRCVQLYSTKELAALAAYSAQVQKGFIKAAAANPCAAKNPCATKNPGAGR